MKNPIHRISNLIKSFTAFLLIPLLFVSVQTFGQAANLDQIRNGALGVYPTTPTADWVNGNAGPSNAHFAEGYSIPYRVKVSGLVGTSATTHTLIIEWDTKHGNGHAIDYITHYQNLENPLGSHPFTFGHGAELVVPTMGTAFSGSPELWDILVPSVNNSEMFNQPAKSQSELPGLTGDPNINKFASWGATDVVLTYETQDDQDGTTAQTETRLKIEFKSVDGKTALFAWGGHIAAEYDWGTGRGATGVSGSPYHTRIISIDGKPGNQDRSLKATAVIIPPPPCGISPAQFACPETSALSFSATGSATGAGVTYAWTINNSNTAGAKIDGSAAGFTISVVPIGADFLAGGTFNLTLVVTKTGAQPQTCNLTPAGTIIKTIVNAAANPTQIDITDADHNSLLTATIDGTSTYPNITDYTYHWEITSPAGSYFGSLSNEYQRIATYTAGVGDVLVNFKVTATLNVTNRPACIDDATTSVSVTAGTPCSVSPSNAVCQGVTVTHNGGPSPKPTNATYVWSITEYQGTGSTTSAPNFTSTPQGGVTMDVTANESYTITLTQTYLNPALNTSCSTDVVVVPTPTVSATYNAPACDSKTFTLTVPSVSGSTYLVTQPLNSNAYSSSKPGTGTNLSFTGLTNGDGFVVTRTTDVASCPASTSCPDPLPVAGRTPEVTNAVTTKEDLSSSAAKAVNKEQLYKIAIESPTKVNAVPNPYQDRVKFNLVSGLSGMGSLELYNSLGQRIAVVFQGYVHAGKAFNKEYVIPAQNRGALIYVFKVGDQKVTGKLVGSK